MSRQTELAQIHIAKKQLAMDDDTYRMMLHNITGKSSTKEMTIDERYRVLAHLKKVGFKPKRGKKRLSPQSSHKKPGFKTIIDKIRAIWIEMAKEGYIKDGSETALNHWIERMTKRWNKGNGIASIDWVQDIKMAQMLLESLKKWQIREQSKPSCMNCVFRAGLIAGDDCFTCDVTKLSNFKPINEDEQAGKSNSREL